MSTFQYSKPGLINHSGSLKGLSRWLLLCTAFISVKSFAVIEDREDKLFAVGKTGEAPLYTQKFHIDRSESGAYTSESKIFDADGKLMMSEVATGQGPQVLTQKVQQLQTNEAWEIEVIDKKVHFRTFKILPDGKQEKVGKDALEDLEGNFVNGPAIQPFVQAHWDALVKGDSLYVRFAVLELAETVGFKFWKKSAGEYNKKPVLVLGFKPSNFLISAVVDPIEIQYDMALKKPIYYKGRTPLKQMVKGKLKPFDAEIIYGQ